MFFKSKNAGVYRYKIIKFMNIKLNGSIKYDFKDKVYTVIY